MQGLLERYEATNLMMKQEGMDIRTGIAINTEQVLEAYVNIYDNIEIHITPIREYMEDEGIYDFEVSKIQEILPIGSRFKRVYGDEVIDVVKINNGPVAIATRTELTLVC